MLELPHHDGSEEYVSEAAPEIGQKVTLRVRVPSKYPADELFVRILQDGEPVLYAMEQETGKGKRPREEVWWRVEVEIINFKTNYRFLIRKSRDHAWLNGAGLFQREVVDHFDFKIVAHRHPPEWLRNSIFYQIFPDRFAKSEIKKELPSWAIPRKWNEIPARKQSEVSEEFYGGDFVGVKEHLHHIIDLGVNGMYFTPIFPSGSNHRYDAYSFEEVDPLLGGDRALIDLKRACERAGIKVIGDLTTNHCGIGHPWIKKALKNPASKYRGYFYWNNRNPWGYVGWWDVPSLPKLNYRSASLRRDMWAGKNAIVRKWLKAPFNLDGWRIDVGNMTGRYIEDDYNSEVAQEIRRTIEEVKPDSWLVAENADFYADDLAGFGWHGTMNYAGFTRPIWQWINTANPQLKDAMSMPPPLPSIDGPEMVAMMRDFAGGIPWRSLISSMILLGSHDRARFHTVVNGNVARHLAGAAMLLTYLGVPSIYAGDEIGLEGLWGENGRRTIPWDDKQKWNVELLEGYRKLIKLRRSSHALSHGGLRWILIEDDVVAYLRESSEESLLVAVSRGGATATIDLNRYGYLIEDTLYGTIMKGKRIKVHGREASAGIWKLRRFAK